MCLLSCHIDLISICWTRIDSSLLLALLNVYKFSILCVLKLLQSNHLSILYLQTTTSYSYKLSLFRK